MTTEYNVSLKKGRYYDLSALQQGIDVVLLLCDKTGKILREQDSPNGREGVERIVYQAPADGSFLLRLKPFDDPANSEKGQVILQLRHFTDAEAEDYRIIERENAKNVLTLDVDHFWEAFDALAGAKTHADSVATIQHRYLDRATSGLVDFMAVRDFSAENFVRTIAARPKFYRSVRANTYEVKKAEPLIENVFRRFNELYPNFKPFKVCFAVGVISTGGTVSGRYVLIGSEVSTSTGQVDFSEFNDSPYSRMLAKGGNVVQKISNMVAHECVHTQQPAGPDAAAVQCPLLYYVMREGFCDFVGELVAGSTINDVAHEYGNAHEAELWKELKSQLCMDDGGTWLYNYSLTDIPGDLGYYFGYRIAQAYYTRAADKKQAVVDIIEMDDPLLFLQKSGYDPRSKEEGRD